MQINARLAVWCEPHNLPFVGVRLKAQIVRECRIKKAERIRPGDRPYVFEMATPPAPKGSRFPCTASIQNEHGSVIKAGIRICADCVRQVVIDEPKFRLGGAKLLAETVLTAALVPHTDILARGVEQCARIDGLPTERKILEIMEIRRARRRPTLT